MTALCPRAGTEKSSELLGFAEAEPCTLRAAGKPFVDRRDLTSSVYSTASLPCDFSLSLLGLWPFPYKMGGLKQVLSSFHTCISKGLGWKSEVLELSKGGQRGQREAVAVTGPGAERSTSDLAIRT